MGNNEPQQIGQLEKSKQGARSAAQLPAIPTWRFRECQVRERIWSADSEHGEQLAGGPGTTLGLRNWAYGRA